MCILCMDAMSIPLAFFNIGSTSDFAISSRCFTLFSLEFGAPKDNRDERADRVKAEWKLPRLTVTIAFWECEAMINCF